MVSGNANQPCMCSVQLIKGLWYEEKCLEGAPRNQNSAFITQLMYSAHFCEAQLIITLCHGAKTKAACVVFNSSSVDKQINFAHLFVTSRDEGSIRANSFCRAISCDISISVCNVKRANAHHFTHVTENRFRGGHLNSSELHKIIVAFYFEVLFAPTMIIFSNFCLHHKYSTLHAKINLMTHRYPCDTDVPTLCNLPSYVLACTYLTVGPSGYWYL